jgi:exodeoxyribonuclease V beta subunit
MTRLDLSRPIPSGSVLLEASAGTGKTFALTALIARSLAEGRVGVDNLLVVTFTRAATRELRDKVREKINEAMAALRQADGPPEPWISPLVAGSATERAERLARLQAAAIDLDRAWITTIHGFCRQALQLLGTQGGLPHDATLEGGSSKARRQAVRDAVLKKLLHQPDGLAPEPDARYENYKDRDPGKIETDVNAVVKHALQNWGTNLAPDPSWKKTDDLTAGALEWSALVQSTIDEITERRRRSGNLDFDDLIRLLDDALNDQKIGNAVVRSLRTRFRMVFVDEFQDTDTLQWKIFERAFLDDPSTLGAAADVFVVGDPKQAIYRFRGADVDAYLDVARTAGAAGNRYDLDVNYRSVGDLITIYNDLYRGAIFGHPKIKYRPVRSAPNQPPTASSLPAMTVRWMMPGRTKNGGWAKNVSAPKSKTAVLTDLANEVTRLLSNHRINTDKEPRPVKAGDIAILVGTNDQATDVVKELQERDIPVIQARTGSVLESPVVRDLRLLLKGMDRPSDLPSVRAAAISRFVGAQADDLLDDDALVDLQDRLGRWSEVTKSSGPYDLLQQLRADRAVLDALVADGDGTRHLTDLEHVIELLHAGSNGDPAGPDTLMRILDNLIAEGNSDEASSEVHSEEVQRRIATDEESVQVSTIHAAKGLEYPIVLLPFPTSQRRNRSPYSYLAKKKRWLDVAPLHKWEKRNHPGPDERKKKSSDESDGDEQRKLYVALTRAKHSVVAWWRPLHWNAGLTRLLFNRDASSGDVDTSKDATSPAGANFKTHFSDLEKKLTGGLLKTEEVSIPVTPLAPGPNAPPPAPPGTPASVDTSNFTDPAWATWSFSEVAKATQRRFKDPAPPTGGTDEPPRQIDRPPVPSSGLSDMPAGRDVGIFLHEVIEKVDFRSPSIQDDLVKRLTGSWQLGTADPESVADGLVKAMETPLAPTFSDTRLLDVEPVDRLNELIFDLRLADTTDRIALAEVCRTVPTASSDDPYSSYFADLADRMDNMNVAGHLTGSIDLVLRLDGPRFLVVDYKSNRVHPPGDPSWLDHYEEAPLREEMIKHDYPLQVFLYSVALHRYLRWRLPDYDPSTHLGGSAYLFLRGMVGPPGTDSRTTGVTCWRPPIEAVLSADRILAGGQ